MIASHSPDLSVALRALLSDFLKRADLVKFAGLVPDPDEIEESVEVARRFLRETGESQGGDRHDVVENAA